MTLRMPLLTRSSMTSLCCVFSFPNRYLFLWSVLFHTSFYPSDLSRSNIILEPPHSLYSIWNNIRSVCLREAWKGNEKQGEARRRVGESIDLLFFLLLLLFSSLTPTRFVHANSDSECPVRMPMYELCTTGYRSCIAKMPSSATCIDLHV